MIDIRLGHLCSNAQMLCWGVIQVKEQGSNSMFNISIQYDASTILSKYIWFEGYFETADKNLVDISCREFYEGFYGISIFSIR